MKTSAQFRMSAWGVGFLLLAVVLPALALGQINWKRHGTPVLSPGAPDTWDDQFVAPGTVIFRDSVYKMWYSGFDGTYMRIGYATSPDGIIWTKHGSPVLDLGLSGSWEDRWVGIPMEYATDTLYHMWYFGDDGTYERGGYATSTDGINWTKYPQNPVLDLGPSGSWDDFCAIPGPLIHDSTFKMIYSGFEDVRTSRAGYATSPNGTAWSKAADHVVDLGTWDTPRVQPNSVLFDGSRSQYVLFYGGGDVFAWRIGSATATDLSGPWTKGVSIEMDVAAGTWESLFVSFPCVLYDSVAGRHLMWYMGGSIPYFGSVGYAVEDSATSVDNAGTSPALFWLGQNYPNPFNPATTISYQLPQASHVSLRVIDVLGREVAVLVNQKQNAGSYSVVFQADHLPSGVYFYQMVSESFTDTKKLLLLR